MSAGVPFIGVELHRAHYKQVTLQTPFHERTAALNQLNLWHRWRDYTVSDAYFSVTLEYTALRNTCAVFDLSPMSKHLIRGKDAEIFLNRLVTRDVRKLTSNRVAYTIWCDEDGQVIDDGTLFHLDNGEYWLCAQERQMDWLHRAALGFEVEIVERTHDWAALALQGPTSWTVLDAMGIQDLQGLKPFQVCRTQVDGINLTIARTGFTGDLGYELFCERADALALWDRLFEVGAAFGIKPMGTHALEIARIEAGLIQAGTDFLPADHAVRHHKTRNPFELDLAYQVDFNKGFFNGREALKAVAQRGSERQLLRLKVAGNKVAKDAYLYNERREHLGTVTSATWSPMLKQSIALASVDRERLAASSQIIAEVYYQKELAWSRVNVECVAIEGGFFNPPRRRATPPERF